MKKHSLYPMTFAPIYKRALWGGTSIATNFNRASLPNPCAESWEISTHDDDLSVVTNGPFAGRTLKDVVSVFGRELLGTKAPDATKFPLLFKILDITQPLSLQVHPSDDSAKTVGGEPKSEMWYILDAKHDSELRAGCVPNTTVSDFTVALTNGSCMDYVAHVPAKKGDIFYIPGGMIHSGGAGYLIYEVQQASNTTFRLFDWNRVDSKTGKPRELHIEEGVKALDVGFVSPNTVEPHHTHHHTRVMVKTPHFTFATLELNHVKTLITTPESFMVLFCSSGKAVLHSEDAMEITLRAGVSVLIPAKQSVTLTPVRPSTILVTTL